MKGQTQFSTKFAANLSFIMPGWSPVTVFFAVFWSLIKRQICYPASAWCWLMPL
jgi:hypothetical protein